MIKIKILNKKICISLMVILAVITAATLAAFAAGQPAPGSEAPAAFEGSPKGNPIWNDSLAKYRSDDKVRHLIFVQWEQFSSIASIQVYQKEKNCKNAWTMILECPGYVGRTGVKTDKKEGDSATPYGDFGVLTAFGIKRNPGTKLDWVDVTDDIWCPDGNVPDYNKIVNAKKGGSAQGEMLIKYSPQYNYGMFLDYNKDGVYGAGSAIFFHCVGPLRYTGGCVAVSEKNMKRILKIFGRDDRVIIAPYTK